MSATASCNKTKKTFQTRKEAKAFLKRMNKHKVLDRELTNVYWCEICMGFHVTSADKRESRKYTHKLNNQ